MHQFTFLGKVCKSFILFIKKSLSILFFCFFNAERLRKFQWIYFLLHKLFLYLVQVFHKWLLFSSFYCVNVLRILSYIYTFSIFITFISSLYIYDTSPSLYYIFMIPLPQFFYLAFDSAYGVFWPVVLFNADKSVAYFILPSN